MADSDRLEREIEEILGKIERFPEADSRRTHVQQRVLRQIGTAISARQRAVARELARISLSQVMLVSFLMILGAFFFRKMSPLAMDWLMYAGIILFVSSFAILMFGRRGGGTVRQNWRGRPVRYQTGPTLSQHLRRWWNSRGTRR